MFPTISYLAYEQQAPQTGKHILATLQGENIIVYQAYRPSIGQYALHHQRFGGDFKLTRMSWIKPNFLWMMYRSGWGQKEGQTYVLGIEIPLKFFIEILNESVVSSYKKHLYPNKEDWQAAIAQSDVRLQWDPDHHPTGTKLDRKAVQLGLRGDFIRRYAQEEIVAIHDMRPFIAEQLPHLKRQNWDALQIPAEQVLNLEGVNPSFWQ
ncbi:MAG: DUF4291 domain-containing protein [Aureispira sp.]